MNKKQEVYIGFNSQFSKTTGFSNTYIAQEVKELTDEEILEVWRENERVFYKKRFSDCRCTYS